MNTVTIILVYLLLVAAFLYLSLRISISMSRRAICKVVNTFRENNAVLQETAVTLKEVGLTEQPRFFTILRDYKPYAVQALAQAQILRRLPDDRFYLSEAKEAELENNVDIHCGS